MKNDKNITEFIKIYTKALKDKTAGVFAGAGLSKSAGLVDWRTLLKDIAKDLNLDINKETDLIALAQYHTNEHGNHRHRINQLLIDEFNKDIKVTELHKILANLPIMTYWTTNYDKLIENALQEAGKTVDIKITEPNLATNLSRRDAVVYKMHGDTQFPDQAVLTKDDYENYNSKRQLFTTSLQGDLVSKTFLFIGFSFSDPNIDYILSRVRVLLAGNQRSHYNLMRRVKREDFKTIKEFHYATIRQELQINDLKRFAINTILLDEYSDFVSLLKIISNGIKRNNIFISGSADNYGKWGQDRSIKFVHELSKKLSQNGFSIVSGFGLGIGSAVINGVLEQIYSSNYRHIDEQLILRPFPQFASGKHKLCDLWHEYRSEMISNAGTAIFIFGNKKDINGKIINADGLEKEFEIAKKCGLKLIPIGITGFASEILWDRMWKDINKYYDRNGKILKMFAKLGGKSRIDIKNVADIVVDLVKLIQKEG
jgi:hypothetical protein